ncbi:MAG: Stf0 sulfotransferase family protein [Verrucomicrobiota bacterium]|nr:Stf0 sulfotransferase family protein [Verrucomicrobiota bacterium]
MPRLLNRLVHGQRCYVVCATARTGSNLFVDGLAATGHAGRPNQFFLEKYEEKFARKHGVAADDFGDYVQGIVRNGSSANAVFGFKLMSWYLESFLGRLRGSGRFGGGSDAAVLRAAFPRLQFLHVVRENKLRQAISKARALQTGVWKLKSEEQQADAPEFDAALIDDCLAAIERDEQTWSHFFQRDGLQPFQIEYERLCSDYAGTIRAVFDFLKIRLPRSVQIGPPVTIRQSDALSNEWEQRYRGLTSSRTAASTPIHV